MQDFDMNRESIEIAAEILSSRSYDGLTVAQRIERDATFTDQSVIYVSELTWLGQQAVPEVQNG